MIIKSVKIKDTLGIEFAEIQTTGGPVDISGPNGSGKSSIFLSMLMFMFGGKFDPERPIRNGKDIAIIELELGERSEKLAGLRGRLTFTRVKDGEKASKSDTARGYKRDIKVWQGNARVGNPQDVLNQVTTALLFDPMAFLAAGSAEQIDLLMGSGAVEIPIDLGAHDMEHSRLYDERTIANREAERLEQHALSLPHHPDAPADTVSTADAMLEAAQELADKKQRLLNSAQTSKVLMKQSEDAIKGYKKEIARLQAEIKQNKEQIGTLNDSIKKDIVDSKAVEVPDIVAIRQKASGAGDINAQVEDNKRRVKASEEAVASRIKASELDQAVKANVKARNKAMAESKFPYAGMSFAQDKKGKPQIMIGDVPLSQVNTAQAVEVAVAVLAAINPDLKCGFIAAGNDLDPDTRAKLDAAAAEKGIEIWYHVVTAQGDKTIGFCLDDGVLVAVNGKPVEKPAEEPAEEATDGLFEEKKDG